MFCRRNVQLWQHWTLIRSCSRCKQSGPFLFFIIYELIIVPLEGEQLLSLVLLEGEQLLPLFFSCCYSS